MRTNNLTTQVTEIQLQPPESIVAHAAEGSQKVTGSCFSEKILESAIERVNPLRLQDSSTEVWCSVHLLCFITVHSQGSKAELI